MSSESARRQRVAFVQGASRGIGLAMVRQLSRAGLRVIGSCRSPAAANALNAIAAREPSVEVVELEVTSEPSIARAAERCAALTGEIDILVNTAGFLHAGNRQPERRLAEVTSEQIRYSFEVNAIGPLLVARYFEGLLSRSNGAVFASLSARVGSIGDNRRGGWYGYRASKAAQNMFTKNLAIEWSRKKPPIICLALHPGTVATDLSAPFSKRLDPNQIFAVERGAAQLIDIILGARQEDSGRFIAWDGQDIEW